MYQVQPTILDGLIPPAGLDENVLKDNLLIECAELEVLYSDADFLEAAITHWSAKQQKVWSRLYNAEKAQYNPIENYDRIETWTDNSQGNRSIAGQQSSGSTTQSSGSDQDSATGYNTSVMQATGKTDHSSVTTDSANTRNTGTEDSNVNSTHSGRVHGNIGVTTSQQMLEQELEVVPKLNVYDAIISDFKRRFCLLVY